jgi:tRNA threonylcarbamoyladenosine biosynthesis protein TsaB
MILCIETSSTVCSVAIVENGVLIALEESNEAKNHSSVLVPMVDMVLERAGVRFTQLTAVAVSAGPGSYTGLRIGTSTAKGYCMALGVPLISVSTLPAIANGYVNELGIQKGLVCPMFDARRQEVYFWLGDTEGNELKPVQPLILEDTAFASFLATQKIVFIGEGSKKASLVLRHSNASFVPNFNPSAKWLGPIAEEKFRKGDFENVAYFEPFYLKETLINVKKA